ncbi:HAD-superfamily subfamily IIA hydrolase [Saprolegnia diclina VS20]|uniref:HAD-superfamily subfamily IIA hydrolase n=1 Tax=Saprolegnia diclina (strain VS20) TaxID=1156394 RepID=T0QEK6_SAPDV|nr:HAD-superfamily subfamily IIA hydrolase [Saprolegnia diclina VS20]EQC33181.1 HAD-superfamily subfamily IIA hydrolase [Saprolegnia diclina VS20]|eukprot:XP_008613304.1 HAD-superfamily subfamily IIA hydrolase [Saprolegnia diclina VS20]
MHQVAKRFGVVFDVDGVLLRGKTPIPGATRVLQSLRDSQTPFAIMTNGGGVTEEKKAAQLSEILDFEIQASRLCLAHTPMRSLVPTYRDEMILAVGKKCDATKEVMNNYGFRNVVTVSDIHSHFPSSYPDIAVPKVPHLGKYDAAAFKAVFVLMDPIYWGRELQIIMDVLTSHEGQIGTISDDQHVNMYSACSDFQYVGEHHLPRFGAGAFRAVLEDLYTRTTGDHLTQTLFGKPEKTSYAFAETLLQSQLPAADALDRIYMVGDNPFTDIKGANAAGDHWKSVLTRTGMYTAPPGVNHPQHPGDAVVDDVAAALAWIESDFMAQS